MLVSTWICEDAGDRPKEIVSLLWSDHFKSARMSTDFVASAFIPAHLNLFSLPAPTAAEVLMSQTSYTDLLRINQV